ncbi:Hok/Gef family protein [Leclercia adecarboxylata]|uniref:Hok/Gef family protein n=1 Tax=Leclercia adecarboxylata TaxID=83655 RepID=UPI0032E8008F
MHGTGSGKPHLNKNQGWGPKQHVRTREVRCLTRLRSKEASMKRRDPSIGVLMIISLTIIILTLVTRKTLCEIRFRNGSLEVIAQMDCRSGS